MSRKKKRMKSWKQNPSEKKTQNQLENKVEKETKENQFNRAETIFLNSISHDIRTPLNVIIGYTALASAHVNEAQEVKKYLSKIETASNHLLLLINDVLDMSHIESGTLKLEHAPVYLPDVLENLKAIIQTDSSAKQLKFCADTKNMVHKNVITDKLRLNQVLLNILENAVKYTRPGGKIYFQIQELKEQEPGFAKYEFRVKDTGIGMSEDFIAHIFESFSREQTSTVSGIEGMGLGMAIVKKIVDRMGGTIAVKSRQGKGTEVTVILPFKVNSQVVECETKVFKKTGQMKMLSERENSENLFKGKKILLTEDNELNREIAVELLKEEGFILDTAEDGTIAVEKMRTAKPDQYDLILMDIQMPILNGYEATKKIRQLENRKKAEIPILAMTANAFEEDAKQCFAAGMNAHIAKPIDIEFLEKTLQRIYEQL